MPVWKRKYPGVEELNVAVMGCIVNGPGESKHADIGISLPGTGEAPAAPVFIDGEEGRDAARRQHRRRVPGDRRRLHREALRRARAPNTPDMSMTMLKPSAVKGMNDINAVQRHERHACPTSPHLAVASRTIVRDWLRALRLPRTSARRWSSPPRCSCAAIGEVTDIVEKEMYSFVDRLNGDS